MSEAEIKEERVLLRTNADVYDGKGFVKLPFILTNLRIQIENDVLMIKDIEDIEYVRLGKQEAIKVKTENKEYIFRLPEKVQRKVYRYLAFNLRSDRFAVYFLSPATRGGVVLTDAKWEKGYLSITENAIWFLSPNKQVRIALSDLGSIERDVRTISGKKRVVLVVGHVEKGEVLTSLILCPETTMEMLENYLKKLIEKEKGDIKLSEIEEQIATLIYSGLDSAAIESMLNLSTEELNMYYDRLVNLGLAKVVKIRKELELTPKGIKVVTESLKSKTNVG